jgi:hypothetical protein
VTDYPDPDLVQNLEYNISHCEELGKDLSIFAEVLMIQSPHFLDTYNRRVMFGERP